MALTDLALLSCNGMDHGLGERAQGRPGETNWMGDPGRMDEGGLRACRYCCRYGDAGPYRGQRQRQRQRAMDLVARGATVRASSNSDPRSRLAL